MTGWAIALILYLLPILAGLRHFGDELEDAKDWLRESGNWFPGLAPYMVVISLVIWPLMAALDAVMPRRDDE